MIRFESFAGATLRTRPVRCYPAPATMSHPVPFELTLPHRIFVRHVAQSSRNPWWPGADLNCRPRGYEPREIPNFSTRRRLSYRTERRERPAGLPVMGG